MNFLLKIFIIFFLFHCKSNNVFSTQTEIATQEAVKDIFLTKTSKIISNPDVDGVLSKICQDIYSVIYGNNSDNFNVKTPCKVFHFYDKDNIDIIPVNDNIFLISSGFFIKGSKESTNLLYQNANLLKLMLTFVIASRVLEKNPYLRIEYNQTPSVNGANGIESYLFVDGKSSVDIEFYKSFFKNSMNFDLFFANNNYFNQKLSRIPSNVLSKEQIKNVLETFNAKRQDFFYRENKSYNNITGFVGSDNFSAQNTVFKPTKIEGYMNYICVRSRNCRYLYETYWHLFKEMDINDYFFIKMVKFLDKYPVFIANAKLLYMLGVSQDFLNDLQNKKDNFNFLYVSQLINFALNNQYNILKDILNTANSLNTPQGMSAFNNSNLIYSANLNTSGIYDNQLLKSELQKYYDFYQVICDKKSDNDNQNLIKNFNPIDIDGFGDDFSVNSGNFANISYPGNSLNYNDSNNDNTFDYLKNFISSLKIVFVDLLLSSNKNNIFFTNYLNFVFGQNLQYIDAFYKILKSLKNDNKVSENIFKEYIDIIYRKLIYLINNNLLQKEDKIYSQIFLINLMNESNRICESLQAEFTLLQNITQPGKLCTLIEKIDKFCSVNMSDYNFVNQKQQCLFLKQQTYFSY